MFGVRCWRSVRHLTRLWANALLTLCLLSRLIFHPVKAGTCWMSVGNNGRCQSLLSSSLSQEECCSISSGATWGWTPHVDVDLGRLFYWSALAGGAPLCQPCQGESTSEGIIMSTSVPTTINFQVQHHLIPKTCENVTCSPGKKCRIRHNQPRCVCAPNCSRQRLRHRGSICGTDYRSYRNHCSMLKFNCRHSASVEIDYLGKCQRSCERVQCGDGKNCILDQNGLPHCVDCGLPCPTPSLGPEDKVCGVDGITYDSMCHFRRATCTQGRSIGVSYLGECRENITCTNFVCPDNKHCLEDPVTHQPLCRWCDDACSSRPPVPPRTVCGSDNNTYSSWCTLQRTSCQTGFIITTQHSGPCGEHSLGSVEHFYDSSNGSLPDED